MLNKTSRLESVEISKDEEIKEVLREVYSALQEKGYNPTDQLIGYLMSNDPTYITAHNGARHKITKVDREEIIGLLLNNFLK